MRRRIAPGTVLTFGLCLAAIAFVMWAVETTALDRGPVHREAREVLAEAPAHRSMSTRLAAAVAATSAVDPAALNGFVERAMAQPEFVAAFAGALDGVQEHVVDGASGPITLDPALVTSAVRAAAAGDPQVNGTLVAEHPLVVQIPDDEIPNLAQWSGLWEMILRALGFIGLLLVTYGLLVSDRRIWAAGRIGRWAIVVGVGTLVFFWLVPRVFIRPLGGWIAVGGVVAGAGDQLVPICLVLVAVGALAVIGAHRWETNDRKRVLSAIPHAPSRSTTPWESPV